MDTIRRRRAALLAVTCLVGSAAAGPAAAGGDGAALGLVAVGPSSSHFDLTMQPGEARTLEVEITNNSDAPASAYTYAADVYTIVNGGFGGRQRGEPTSGTTRWLDYNPETLLLAVGSQSIRRFTVTVPDDTRPGEYITSIVLETELIDQRQALAVVVTVPGPRSPALEIGEASHAVVEGTSVLAVALSNEGNVRLSPMVELELRDATGAHVADASLHMDTFYALTDTSVEVLLDVLLVEGTYSIEVVAEDVQQEVHETSRVSLVVGGGGIFGAGNGIVGILTTEMEIGTTRIPVILVTGLLAGVVMVAGTMRASLHRLKRRPRPSDAEV